MNPENYMGGMMEEFSFGMKKEKKTGALPTRKNFINNSLRSAENTSGKKTAEEMR